MRRNFRQEIYEYVKQRCENDISPTIREIGAALDIKSTSTVHRYVGELAQQGLVEKDQNRTRTIQIPGSRRTNVPVVGVITAGVPITAIEHIVGYLPFETKNKFANPLFALSVRGDSMKNTGIFDGDFVVIEQIPVAENGQIVAAMIDGEATVKRFYKENGGYRLQPENPDFQPIVVDEVVVLGRVVASIRYYD